MIQIMIVYRIIVQLLYTLGMYTGGISVRNASRGFDVLKEGIFDDRNRKTKNRND